MKRTSKKFVGSSFCADALARLPLELVDLLVAPPHQSQAAPDRLFQQDLRLTRSQGHDDADVVDVEALTEHEDAHDDLGLGVPVEVE